VSRQSKYFNLALPYGLAPEYFVNSFGTNPKRCTSVQVLNYKLQPVQIFLTGHSVSLGLRLSRMCSRFPLEHSKPHRVAVLCLGIKCRFLSVGKKDYASGKGKELHQTLRRENQCRYGNVSFIDWPWFAKAQVSIAWQNFRTFGAPQIATGKI
jgi:hypothetical protein